MCAQRPMLYPNELRAQKKYGRGGEIRTPDPLLPKQLRYQAALHPENCLLALHASCKARNHTPIKNDRQLNRHGNYLIQCGF